MLYGSETHSFDDNIIILEAVNKFIKHSNRCQINNVINIKCCFTVMSYLRLGKDCKEPIALNIVNTYIINTELMYVKHVNTELMAEPIFPCFVVKY